MNQSLIQLRKISGKKKRTIIGLMSGTSLDGLDIALCRISGSGGQTDVTLSRFITVDYTQAQKKLLKKISSVETLALKDLCYMHTRMAVDHAEMINQTLKKWKISNEDVDCIASHGQTIYHLPARDQKDSGCGTNSTLQIADGDQIAVRTGILTISDFRQKHTAHGGEGAPMAALVDRLLFGSESEPRILLNIGGIANFTFLPSENQPGQPPFTTDTGPGNTLIDNVVQHYFNQPYDEDGLISGRGAVRSDLLDLLLSDEWFQEAGSKSTGPEYFNMRWIKKLVSESGIEMDSISPEDLVATVTELSARTIADSIKVHGAGAQHAVIYASGGGARNPVLIERLRRLLPEMDLRNFSDLGIESDAKEAVIFAVLANEMLAGDGFLLETNDGIKKVNFGKISFP